MGLRRRISFQWQLFIPLVAMLWIAFFVICIWQYNSDRDARKEQIKDQLALINARIIDAYDEDYNVESFLSFISQYYIDNPIYDRLRISIYRDDKLFKCYGEPIELSRISDNTSQGLLENKENYTVDVNPNKFFYYK